MKSIIFICVVSMTLVSAEIYFKEYFNDGDAWAKRWKTSEHKNDFGKFQLTSGKFYGDEEDDKGIQTSQDAKFYADSTSFDKFTNKDKNLVVQFSVKHEQTIDCGGGYVKLFPSTLDRSDMHGDSVYNIMFGPDICGPGTKKVHVIFQYKGKNLLIKNDIRCKDDEFTHVYTLIVKPDNTYEVLIDNKSERKGKLEEDWDFLPPKEIKDPDQKKPSQEEWDEREKIDDPEDTKPDDWEKPEHIPDADAEQPEDWDEEMDGEWEPPMVDNPEYKGEWKPKQIDNPDYKGKWVHPMIANPEYEADDYLYSYEDFGAIGLDLWQVKSGTIFDNFLITDEIELAKDEANKVIERAKKEKKMKEDQDAEAKKKEEEEAKDDDEDEDDEGMGELEDEDEEEEPQQEEEEAEDSEENLKDEL